MFKELKLFTSFRGMRAEFNEVLWLVKEEKLNPMVQERPMSGLLRCVKAMEEGQLKGRYAFVPGM